MVIPVDVHTGRDVSLRPIGSDHFAASQATVGTSATLICAARIGTAGVGRIEATIQNNGAVTVYLGGANVTTATGIWLGAGEARTLGVKGAIYGVVSAGTCVVDVLESY